MNSAIEGKIDDKRREIKRAVCNLGKRLAAGDDRDLLVWIIPESLACGHRPLRHHPKFGKEVLERNELYGRPDLPPEATSELLNWIRRIKSDYLIRSIISLMDLNELRRYAQLDLGAKDLIDLYRKSFGIDRVRHIPWADPAHQPTLTPLIHEENVVRVRELALRAFDELPKPVLLHCSAGIQRSSPVAAHIWAKRSATPI